MKKQPFLVAVLILVLLGLIFWAAHIGWHGLSIEHKLDPVLLATLAVSVFIAYYLQYYFVSRTTADSSEKQILLDDLRDILSMLRQLRDLLMTCHDSGGKVSPTNAKSIKLLLRRIANGLDSLETAIGMSHCASLGGECKPIQQALFDYKSAATGGSFPTKPYDAHAFTYQEKTYRALDQKLRDLVFRITRFV